MFASSPSNQCQRWPRASARARCPADAKSPLKKCECFSPPAQVSLRGGGRGFGSQAVAPRRWASVPCIRRCRTRPNHRCRALKLTEPPKEIAPFRPISDGRTPESQTTDHLAARVPPARAKRTTSARAKRTTSAHAKRRTPSARSAPRQQTRSEQPRPTRSETRHATPDSRTTGRHLPPTPHDIAPRRKRPRDEPPLPQVVVREITTGIRGHRATAHRRQHERRGIVRRHADVDRVAP